ncbi:hypothetical protein HOI83_04435 [Candidatus Uhrbacteria bacterium]|nr:hypothetical protein [Candidatus Uhrbacteria bacterium]
MESRIVNALRRTVTGGTATDLEGVRQEVGAAIIALNEDPESELPFGFLARKPELITGDDHAGPPRFGAKLTIVQKVYQWHLRNIGLGLLIEPVGDESNRNLRLLMQIMIYGVEAPEDAPDVLVERPNGPQIIRIDGVRYSLDRNENLLIMNLSDPGGPISAELFRYLADI